MLSVLYSVPFSTVGQINDFIVDIANSLTGTSVESLSASVDKTKSWSDGSKWQSSWIITSNTLASATGSLTLSSPFSFGVGDKSITLTSSATTAGSVYVLDARIESSGFISSNAREVNTSYYSLPDSRGHFTIGKVAKVTVSSSDRHLAIAVELAAGEETLLACATETTRIGTAFSGNDSIPYVMFRSSFYEGAESRNLKTSSRVTFCRIGNLTPTTGIAYDSYNKTLYYPRVLPVVFGSQKNEAASPAYIAPYNLVFFGIPGVQIQRISAPLYQALSDKLGVVDGTVIKAVVTGEPVRYIKIDRKYIIQVG